MAKTCAEEQRLRLEAEAQVARLAAALRAALNILKEAGLHNGPDSDDWLAAALSDTQTGTAGEGWAPGEAKRVAGEAVVMVSAEMEGWPEVREQVGGVLRLMLARDPGLHPPDCGCEICPAARAALKRLEVK